MSTRRWGVVALSLVMVLLGVVFGLQNAVGESAIMSGNPTYIYVGGVVALIGFVLLLVGSRKTVRLPRPLSAPLPGGQPDSQ